MARLECCPTCGRPRVETQTPFRTKLLRYCDGTRTMAEVIDLTGSTSNSVHVAMAALRDQGHDVRIKRVKEATALTREGRVIRSMSFESADDAVVAEDEEPEEIGFSLDVARPAPRGPGRPRKMQEV